MATFQTHTFKKKNRENVTVYIENSKNYFNLTRKKKKFKHKLSKKIRENAVVCFENSENHFNLTRKSEVFYKFT